MAETLARAQIQETRIDALQGVVAAMWAVASTGCVVAATVADVPTSHDLALLAILAAGGLLTETFAVRLSDRLEVSAGAVTIILAAVLLGPLAAATVGFATMLADVPKPPFVKWLVHAPLRTVVGLAAGGAAVLVDSQAVYLVILAAACGNVLADFVGNVIITHARRNSVADYVRSVVPTVYLPLFLYLPIVWLIVTAYDHAGVPAMALVFGPALLAQYVYRLYQGRTEAYETLTEGHLSFAIGMVRALEASDSYSAGHSAAVGVYARDLASELGYPAVGASVVQLAALLHDVGKIGVPGDILRKPDRLTETEWNEIKRHPLTGERILGELPVFRHVADAVRNHHERPDGSGYPDGLRRGEIPQAALIIAVADAYSAMTQPRVYRDALDADDAVAELQRCGGRQFDADVVAAFLRVLERATYDYRTGHDEAFEIGRQRQAIFSRLGRPGALQHAAAPL